MQSTPTGKKKKEFYGPSRQMFRISQKSDLGHSFLKLKIRIGVESSKKVTEQSLEQQQYEVNRLTHE